MQVQINRLLELSLAKRSCALERARVVNGTMSDTRVARSPRASPDRTKKKAKGRHGGSRTGSGRKFAHEATSAACAAEAKKPGVIGLRAFMGMDAGKRQDAALRQTAKMHKRYSASQRSRADQYVITYTWQIT